MPKKPNHLKRKMPNGVMLAIDYATRPPIRRWQAEVAELRTYTDSLADRWGITQEESLELFQAYVNNSPLPWQRCKSGFETENLW